MPARFTRHRGELPMMRAFLAIALLELVAVHLLASLWSSTLAWALTALTLLFVVQIVLLMRGLRQWPTVIDETGITVRYGRRGSMHIPLSQVAGCEDVAYRPEERGAGIFRATLIADPNLLLRLEPPLRHGKRRMAAIALRLDDPASFNAALRAQLGRQGQGLRPA